MSSVIRFGLVMLLLASCSSKNTNTVSNSEPTPVKEVDSVKPPQTSSPLEPQEHSNASTIDSNILKNPDTLIAIVKSHPILKDYRVYTDYKSHALLGDFYGDGVQDLALLIEKQGQVHLCIINYTDTVSVYIFGENGQYDDYSWAGVFKKVSAGDTLWSNYIDDFRGFDEVPDDEKVVLPYDAILAHALESCGGGFIFWKDGEFNWLQQE